MVTSLAMGDIDQVEKHFNNENINNPLNMVNNTNFKFDQRKDTAIHFAVYHEHEEIFFSLLKKGANLDQPNKVSKLLEIKEIG